MKFKDDFGLLVINGWWNIHIFQLEWVEKYIFPGEEQLTVELAPFDLQASPRYSTDKIRLSIVNNQLMFEPIAKTEEVFEKIEELGLSIVDYLEHTPVYAFGINFNFVGGNKDLESFFKFADVEQIKSLGVASFLSNYHHSFRLNKNNNFIVKLTISSNSENCSIDFNFHFDIEDLVDFKGKINETSIMYLKNEAQNILSSVYGLEIEQRIG